MLKGFLFAISACFVWGAIFVIPEFLSGFSTIEVVLGRYLTYGILSCFLFFRKGFSKMRSIPKEAWIAAFLFAFFSNIFYYFGLVTGVRFSSAPLTVLIIGLAPILIALYGNWQAREVSFKSMILPCTWIGCGLIFVNVAEVDWTFSTRTLPEYLLGMVGVLSALLSWSWFAVHNARFLKQHSHIPSTQWATVIGVATFVWALITALLFIFVFGGVEVDKFTHISPQLGNYLLGSSILGFLCSWLGCFLWNRASLYLPVSLMGPILIFESLFGLLFVYVHHHTLPSLLEILGALAMLSGILFSVRNFKQKLDKKLMQN